MSEFQRPDISYKPLEVEAVSVSPTASTNTQSGQDEVENIANKLMDHLALIQAYNDRIKAIDYLIDNAKSLSGNLKYSTDDTSLIASIEALGGKDGYVDIKLFEKAVDIVLDGYKEMALISLTGAAKK